MDKESFSYECVSESIKELSLDPVKVAVQLDIKTSEESHNTICLSKAAGPTESSVITGDVLSNLDVDLINVDGETPLMVAVKHGNEMMIEKLIKKGANINLGKYKYTYLVGENCDQYAGRFCETPLQLAIVMNFESIVDILIEAGADVNTAIGKYGSSMETALSAGNIRLASKLLAKGAYLCPFSVLSSLLKCHKKQFMVLIDFVFENGFSVNSKGYRGRSFLHVVVIRQHLAGVRTLLKKGANVNAVDDIGETPLHVAAKGTNCEIFQLLLDHKSDIRAKSQLSVTALNIAVMWNRKHFVRLLLNAGAEMSGELLFVLLHLAPYTSKTATSYALSARMMAIAEVPIKLTQYDGTLSDILTSRYCEFDSQCLAEICQMVSTMFGDVPLYSIFSKRDDPVFTSNLDMRAYVKSDTLKSDFPFYANLLRKKFKEGVKRNILLDGISLSVRIVQDLNVSHIVLPSEMSRKILVYLTDCDLLNVKRAFNAIREQ